MSRPFSDHPDNANNPDRINKEDDLETDVDTTTAGKQAGARVSHNRSSVFVSRASDTGKPTLFNDEHGNLKFVNLICRRPVLIFFIAFSLCIASTLILRRVVKENPITEDTNQYNVRDIRSIAYDTLRLAKEEVKDTYDIHLENKRRLQDSEDDARLQEDFGDITLWIYDAKTDDGVFTKEGIPKIRAAEATILKQENYPEYCVLKYEALNQTTGEEYKFTTPECDKPLSAMNIYYASEWDSDLADEIINEFKSEPLNIMRFNALSLCVEFNFFCDQLPDIFNDEDKEWVTDMSTKMNFMIGKWDGMGELNPNIEQVTEFMAYMKELTTKQFSVNYFLDSNFNLTNQVTMYSRSIFYWGQLLNGTTNEEDSETKLKKFILENLLETWTGLTDKKNNEEVQIYYFMGALIFDIIQMILIGDGLKALGSFVFVFFYLRYMLGSWFLTAVGMFEIVMSLPLAWLSFSYIFQIKYFSALNVLCIFIVMAIGADDIFVFMDSYKQSAGMGADVLNSFETRMSWVYRRSGSAMLLTSITTCGAFLCTLFTPLAGTRSFGIFAAFVILFDYLLVMTLFCTSVVIYHDRFENKSCCYCKFWVKSTPTATETAMKRYSDGEVLKMDPISKFFKEKLGPFMLRGRNRIGVGVVLITWIILAAIYAAKLEPTTSAEQFLNESHPLQIGVSILTDEFPKTQEDRTTSIHLVWGLNEINRDGVNQLLDPEYVGKASYSSDFIFDEQCQSAILDVCSQLQTDENFEEFILRRDGVRSIDCFVEQLGAFNVDPSATCTDVRIGDWTNADWEVSPDNLAASMDGFVSKSACGPDSATVKKYYEGSMGWDGKSMRYAGLSIESKSLDPRGILSEDRTRVIYDKFIQLAKELDQKMESACKTKTTMTDLDQKFVFMNNQRIYRTTAISGSMIGVLVAFIVLFVSTRKLHLSLFATLCILSVLVGVIGSATMLGWTLGTIEAILISILAGFSVDYVIHLAHAYNHAEGEPDERILAAYGEMGVSVFSGMLTSVVASIPLFFCTLTFFAKFGTFLCLTIVLSWIFANFGFMCLLATFKVSMDRKWL